MANEENTKQADAKQVDITKYPEGPEEIIKYMDYAPEEERMGILMGFIYKTFAL